MVEVPDDVVDALARLPDRAGGTALVLATSGVPPAMALLSTGDVLLAGDVVSVAVHATSSVVERHGGGMTLLVPTDRVAYRIEVTPLEVLDRGELVVLSGPVVRIRTSAEPPWLMRFRFVPEPGADPRPFVAFWTALRRWLVDGGSRSAPSLPKD